MNRNGLALLWLLPGLAALAACTKEPGPEATPGGAPFIVATPPGWPSLPVRADNPLTTASVELGRALFFDERLSLGRGHSCASCHRPGRAFSDTVPLSIGVQGLPGLRNAPTLANTAYHALLNRDGGAPTLEQQVLVPLSAKDEMDSDPQQVVDLLRTDPAIAGAAMRAYGRDFDLYVLTRAIANYVRTLIGGHSRYDRYVQGDTLALAGPEVRGMRLFNGAAGCSACHGGFDLSDHAFHNTGIRTDDAADPGRQRITLDPADRGRFKTPTLRNIALTAPYMHDGSMATLEEVIDHFDAGGLPDPNKDPLMIPLQLTPEQKHELAAFLRSLTDEIPLDRTR